MDQPGLAAIDRVDGAAAARIERDVAPGRFRRQQREQLRRTDVARLDALDDGVAGQPRADSTANFGTPSITANQISGADGQRLS